jgi:hypothetical protein
LDKSMNFKKEAKLMMFLSIVLPIVMILISFYMPRIIKVLRSFF